jgi:uncharacterized membrane protein YfcA
MNTIFKYILSIFIGSLIGFLGGFQGIAGGFYISLLLMITGIAPNQRKAAGTTLLAILFPLSIGAVYEYWKSGDIDIPVALIITFAYMIFAFFGAKANEKVDEYIPLLSLSFLMFLTSLYFGYKGFYSLKKLKK